MKKLLRDNYKFIIFISVFGLIGGYFSGKYLLESYTPEILKEVIKQLGSKKMIVIVAMIQSMFYSLVLGILGIHLSKKVNLWKKIYFNKNSFKNSVIFGIISGLLLILPDKFIFNKMSFNIAEIYKNKPSFNFIMSSITYGGVVEEILMRLFLMSLVALIICKIFYSKSSKINDKIYIISNIIISILFALGHLPNTAMTMGLSVLVIIRCMLLNVIFGLIFGYIYRKYGIVYSIITHLLTHIVSKFIWLVFI